jgi:hypothetical protein
MRDIRRFFRSAALLAILAASAGAQIPRPIPLPVPPLPRQPSTRVNRHNEDDRSGPRLGVAYLIGGSVTAEHAGQRVDPLMTLFGWQIEHQFPTGLAMAPTPMTELVVLVGGMEQGAFLPSVSWLIGMRQPNGWEAGVGPTLTGAGVQIALAAGVTHSLGVLNLPMNVAVVPGRRGASISFTTGFNVRRGQ